MKVLSAEIQGCKEGHKVIITTDADIHAIIEEVGKVKNGETECFLQTVKKDSTNKQKSFLWAKINLLADTLRISKQQVYEQMLREYGQGEYIESPSGSYRELRNIYRVVDVVREEPYCCLVYRGIERLDRKEVAILTDGVLWELQQLDGTSI